MLRWDLEWRMTLLTALLLPLLISLGFWQLDRAAEKSDIAAQNIERSLAPAISLAQAQGLAKEQVAFRKLSLSGYFDPDVVILLDNQIRDGRYGHDVLGVFIDEASNGLALLNRGWVEGDPSRRSLPEIEMPSEVLSVTAVAYLPPGDPYLLAEDSIADFDAPVLLQSVNTNVLWEALETSLDRPVYPLELRLTPESVAGYRRDWAIVNVSPQKHQGYAVQWFTMAAALLLLYIFRSSNLGDVLFNRDRTVPDESGRQEKQ